MGCICWKLTVFSDLVGTVLCLVHPSAGNHPARASTQQSRTLTMSKLLWKILQISFVGKKCQIRAQFLFGESLLIISTVPKKQSCGDLHHSVQKTTQIALGKVLLPSFNFSFVGFLCG
jgi:hypothetical protein